MRDAQILVADDSEQVQEKIRTALAAWKVGITSAFNGLQAVNLVAVSAFDLVLMDTGMPVMDGYQATLAIRGHKNPRVNKLPIIALVPGHSPGNEQKCRAGGINEFMAKPIESGRLISTLHRWIPLVKKYESQQPVIEKTHVCFPNARPESLPDVLPGLAFKKTLENLGGDLSLYLELLEQYTREKSNLCPLLRKTLREGDIREGSFLVHGLKGVAGNLGLEKLADCACRLEKTLLQGDLPDMARLLDRLEVEQEAALNSIKILFTLTRNISG